MTSTRLAPAAAAVAALAQTALGLAAHTSAAGCLPALSTLALALPVSVALVAVVGRLLPGLRALVVGQLAVHGVLALAGCTVGAGAHAAHHSPAMALAHVAALALCRATLDHVLATASRAAGVLRRLVARPRPEPAPLRLPVLDRPEPLPIPVPRSADLLTTAPRRGPPRALLPA